MNETLSFTRYFDLVNRTYYIVIINEIPLVSLLVTFFNLHSYYLSLFMLLGSLIISIIFMFPLIANSKHLYDIIAITKEGISLNDKFIPYNEITKLDMTEDSLKLKVIRVDSKSLSFDFSYNRKVQEFLNEVMQNQGGETSSDK